MEARPRNTCFFFANAFAGFDTLFRFGANRFKHLFGDNREGEPNSPERSFRSIVAERHESRYVELIRLADSDPIKIKELEKMPLVDYWHLLNMRIGDINAANPKIRQNKKNK